MSSSNSKQSKATPLIPPISKRPESALAQSIFPGDGEMAQIMRELDWSQTPLGPVNTWSPALRMMARFLLANRFPLLLWWGSQFCQLYNDAYRPILGKKHPQFVGRPVSECWNEIWHILEPLIQTPFAGGPSTWIEEFPLEINRHGFLEETHFTVAYSPVPDETVPGGIGGVLATVHEISEKVLGERRTMALRDLGASIVEERSAEEACARAASVLAKYPKDVAFALLYLLDPDRRLARLAGSAGLEEKDHDIAPRVIEISAAEAAWPLSSVIETGQMKLVEGLERRFASVPPGAWSDPPHSAAIVPIRSNVARQLAGFLIAGISPRLRFDELYRSFLELAAAQIATALTNARAYEEERKRAEALAELDRAKTIFFSNVSHELRTPLTLVLGPTESALSSPQRTLAGAELETVHRNELRLLKLVNTLLDFARIEAGRVQASYEPTDVASLTRDLASEFRSAVEAAGLLLIIDCPPLSEPVYVDREMWEKIVLNLVSNSFKSTFEGEIHVSIRCAGNHAELAVRDTGTGIAKEEVPHLFERFHRIENALRRTQEGTGIGLALVAELVRLHAGSIAVDTAPGRGSTFTVSIPMGTAHLPRERISAPRELSSTVVGTAPFVQEALSWVGGGESSLTTGDITTRAVIGSGELIARSSDKARTCGRVLVVDDNRDMREYAARLLSSRFEVVTAENGRAALDRALEDPPDLVLTDIMMPEMDGFQLLAALRQNAVTNTIPVIFVSARAGEESKVDGLGAGADDYLVKPFTADELLARVQTHVLMARRRSEQARLLNLSNDAIIVRDWDGCIVYWNHGAEKLYGWNREEALGKNIHSFLQTRFPTPLQEINAELSRAGEWTGELVHSTRDGRRITVLCRKVLDRDTQGNPGVVLETNTDITERKQNERRIWEQEERLRRLEKVAATGQLAAALAHEINNPLASVTNCLYLLETNRDLTQEAKTLATTAASELERVSRIVRQSLSYYRVNTVPMNLDLSAIAEESLQVFSDKFRRAGIEVTKRLTPNAQIMGFADEVRQVVDNLLLNAVEALQKGGRLVVSVRPSRNWRNPSNRGVRLTIGDTGSGIAKEYLSHIFEAFFTTKSEKGTGLGLWVVRGIVAKHDGRIRIRSTQGNSRSGTVVSILWPSSKERSHADSAKSQSAA